SFIGFDDSAITALSSSRFFVTRIFAPRKQLLPIVTLCPTVAFTAMNALLPMVTLPEILQHDVSQQSFPITLWWPISAPLHTKTLSPKITRGCIHTLFMTKQFLPC